MPGFRFRFHDHSTRRTGARRADLASTLIAGVIALAFAIAVARLGDIGSLGPREARVEAAARSLAGTTLRPIDDADALVSSVFELLLGGGRTTKGTLDRVVVSEDAERRLVLAVTYRGLANLRLTGEIHGRDRRRQSQIQAQPVALTAADGEASLAFDVSASVPDGAMFESAYLRLIVVDPARPSARLLSRVFALPKTWLSTPNPSSLVLKVALQPIGTAARLGARPDYAAPPRELVPVTIAAPPPATLVRRVPEPVQMRRMQTARIQTVQQAQPVTAMLPADQRLVRLESFKYGVKPEDAQNGAQGPSASPIELLEGLRAEDIGLNPAALLSISTRVYQDKNPRSGIFYYHPRSYHLEWTPESGHGFRILYGAATADGSAGDVLMAARLQSGVDLSEVQLASDLLQAYRQRNRSTIFTALRPLPLEKDGVDVSLGAVLGQYSIPKEKIAITGLSDVLGEIEVSWVTDPVTKENVQLALMQDVGVSGDVLFAAAGGALAPQVPMTIQLADRDSFGRVRWNRADGYRNETPYPVRLRYLHALIVDPRNSLPILYTWSLENVEVPPQARVQWDAARVPAWIDTEAKRVWVEYGVVESCAACDKQVLDRITGGVTMVAAATVTFHTITPLADVGGYELTAYVRSKYFDPKERALLQKSVVLKADNQDFLLKPIYDVPRTAGEPLFEYLLELTMPDGTVHKGTQWIPSENVRVLVGRAQVERSLGTLPGRTP